MSLLIRMIPVLLPIVLVTPGCTTIMIQRQPEPPLAARQDCPMVYRMTRMEWASLEWAFSDDNVPGDRCLALYYPKASRDPFYAESNTYLSPLYMLSLPVDVVVDTLALPFAATLAD